MKFNAITKESLRLLHDLNEKNSSVSFHANFFFFFEINNIVRTGDIPSIS